MCEKECMGNNLQEPPAFMPSPKDSTPLQPGYLPRNRKLHRATTIPVDLSVSAESGGSDRRRSRYGKYSCLLRDPGLMFQELRRVDA